MTISVRKIAAVAAFVAMIVGCTTYSRWNTRRDACTIVGNAHFIRVVLDDGDDVPPDVWELGKKLRAARSSDFKNSTDYFRDLAIWGMNPPSFTIFGGAGVPTCTSTNPYDFRPENNAWCLAANQDQVTNADYPRFFTRNVVQMSADGRTNWALANVEPLGTNTCICLTQGGAILRLDEKDIQGWGTRFPGMTVLRP